MFAQWLIQITIIVLFAYFLWKWVGKPILTHSEPHNEVEPYEDHIELQHQLQILERKRDELRRLKHEAELAEKEVQVSDQLAEVDDQLEQLHERIRQADQRRQAGQTDPQDGAT